jgi:AraC family transcriptional activator of pobA
MNKQSLPPYQIQSISELHRILELPKPKHPLLSVIDFSKIKCYSEENLRSVSYNFYCIAIKKDFEGKLKYGQNYYDFDEGLMTFFAPGQVVTTEINYDKVLHGWWLVVHPDFIQHTSLAKKMPGFGYFSYAVHEALHLSEDEEMMLEDIINKITLESLSPIDQFSQDVIISYLELFLNYCNRFYNRQFLTRKQASNDMLSKLEELLAAYFNTKESGQKGLPTVQYLADQLNVSPKYLSDMLKAVTGQSTQQHIHDKLIEKAKECLTTTSLSVSEIAYQLGFEHPQSFNKLFKSKTNASPLKFRQSFN